MNKLFCTNWSVVADGDDGTMLDINFTCNQCGCDTGTLNYTSMADLYDFEIDVECPVCGSDLTVICCHEDKI